VFEPDSKVAVAFAALAALAALAGSAVGGTLVLMKIPDGVRGTAGDA
jgi:hypothetical protein